LLIYFHRPSSLHHLTYPALFQNYHYSIKLPAHYRNAGTDIEDRQYFTIRIPNNFKNYYLYLRNDKLKSITRLEMVPLTVGEKWYLRLILYNQPVISFIDARTVDGITFQTFQESALARKLVEDENEAIIAFQWATIHSSPPELRMLFVIMTSQGFPTVKIYNDPELRIKLMQDYLLEFNNNMRYVNRLYLIVFIIFLFRRATNELLINFSLSLKDNDKRLSDYGLPTPEENETELQRALLEYDPNQQSELLMQLNTITPNTAEQQNIYNAIMDSIVNKRTSLYFIQGMGGSGKTTLAKKS